MKSKTQVKQLSPMCTPKDTPSSPNQSMSMPIAGTCSEWLPPNVHAPRYDFTQGCTT